MLIRYKEKWHVYSIAVKMAENNDDVMKSILAQIRINLWGVESIDSRLCHPHSISSLLSNMRYVVKYRIIKSDLIA